MQSVSLNHMKDLHSSMKTQLLSDLGCPSTYTPSGYVVLKGINNENSNNIKAFYLSFLCVEGFLVDYSGGEGGGGGLLVGLVRYS